MFLRHPVFISMQCAWINPFQQSDFITTRFKQSKPLRSCRKSFAGPNWLTRHASFTLVYYLRIFYLNQIVFALKQRFTALKLGIGTMYTTKFDKMTSWYPGMEFHRGWTLESNTCFKISSLKRVKLRQAWPYRPSQNTTIGLLRKPCQRKFQSDTNLKGLTIITLDWAPVKQSTVTTGHVEKVVCICLFCSSSKMVSPNLSQVCNSKSSAQCIKQSRPSIGPPALTSCRAEASRMEHICCFASQIPIVSLLRFTKPIWKVMARSPVVRWEEWSSDEKGKQSEW